MTTNVQSETSYENPSTIILFRYVHSPCPHLFMLTPLLTSSTRQHVGQPHLPSPLFCPIQIINPFALYLI